MSRGSGWDVFPVLQHRAAADRRAGRHHDDQLERLCDYASGVPFLTPRATVVDAIARREAELLDQAPTSGHLLVALIWEAQGVAATALSDAGLPKGTDEALRRLLRTVPKHGRGLSVIDTMGVAAKLARELGHEYIGTEHQLLAIAADDTLDPAVFDPAARNASSTRVHELVP